MKHSSPVLIMLMVLLCCSAASQTSVCSYKYRNRITFDPAYVAGPSDLTDFPVFISIPSDNDLRTTGFGGHVSSSSGFDIIFTAADGVTILDFERSKYVGSTGQAQFWVKIPTLSTSVKTFIYMYYGNTSAGNLSSRNVWSNGYVGVWHFDNTVENSSTINGLDGTNSGAANSTLALLCDSKLFTASSSNYVEITPYNSAYDLTGDITLSAWIRPLTTGSTQVVAGNQNNSAGGWKMTLQNNNKFDFEIRDNSNTPVSNQSAGGGTALSANTWYYVAGEYSNSGDFIRTYLNGSLERSVSTTVSCGTSPGTLKFGREPYASSGFFNGQMDEIRLSNVIRSADWLATEYNNQSSPTPGTFYTVSPEPKVWNGLSSASWSTNANWVGGAKPLANEDVILADVPNNRDEPSLDQSIQLSSLWVQTGSTFSVISSNTLSIAYDITNCGAFYGVGTSMVALNSTTNNTQQQYVSGGGAYVFYKLNVNNIFSPSPSVHFKGQVNIVNNLLLNSGIVYTSATNTLMITPTATCSQGSAASFVSGPVSRVGSSAFVFPVGKGSRWRRIAVGTQTSACHFRAEYFDTPYTNSTTVNSPVTNVSGMEYWQLDRLGGTSGAKVQLFWEDASASGIGSCTDLTIAHWNGSAWENKSSSCVSGSSCSGAGTGTLCTDSVVNSFSPFTFGSRNFVSNALPVDVVDFTASCSDDGVNIGWTAETEVNSDHYAIERSVDGISWQEIKQVSSNGYNVKRKNYQTVDPSPVNGISYYRLRHFDTYNSVKTFPIISTQCAATGEQLSLYPNPASGEINIRADLSDDYGEAAVHITDQLGNVLIEKSVHLTSGGIQLSIPLHLPPGAYSVIVRSNSIILPVRKLVVY